MARQHDSGPMVPRMPRIRVPTKNPAPRVEAEQNSVSSSAAVERARLLREQADRAARINAKEAGELIPADMVAEEWRNMVARIRSALLAVPVRVAQQHPGQSSLIATLERELNAAMHEIAEDAQ